MKSKLNNHLCLIFILTIFTSCQKENVLPSSSLNKDNGVYKNKEKPFTGKVLDTTLSGRVILTFNCIDGKPDGEYIEYYEENGNLKQKISYLNGKKTGKYLSLKTNGDTIVYGNFLDFKKNGKWKNYYDRGNIKSSGSFENNLQNGEWKYFYYNGKLNAQGNFINGNESNFGETKVPKNGREGLWKFYSESTGNLAQESNWVNGLKTGQMVSYYSNGQIEFKVNFKDDKFNGLIENFDENGKLTLSEYYIDGIIQDKKESN